MTPKQKAPEQKTTRAAQRERTRDRILAAARELFTEDGYDRTSIRRIATAAQVDTRLVLHYFTSKDTLFRTVLRPEEPAEPGPPPKEPRDRTTAASCPAEELLQELSAKLSGDNGDVGAAIRSMLTNDAAAEAIRRLATDRQASLVPRIGQPDADTRVALIAALFLGVVAGRDLVRLPGLADQDPDRLVALLRPCVHLLLLGSADHHGCSQG